MNTLTDRRQARASRVAIPADFLEISLTDGREIKVPLSWFPTLAAATNEKRQNFRLIGQGEGIHWPELDEDISIKGLL